MTQKQKLLQRLKNNPNNCTFAELQQLLLEEGFLFQRTAGSHNVYRRNAVTFVVPKHGKRVKPVYVKRAIALIEEARRV